MSIYFWLVIFAILLVLSNFYSRRYQISEKVAKNYHYKKKQRIMSEHEFVFYKILNEAVGLDYYIMAQAHLSAFIDHKVSKQNWKAAFRHINQKSVDYLLCNKLTLEPVLAIELDDKTHDQENRITRDKEVERVLTEANVPLLRIPSHGTINILDLKNSITSKVGNTSDSKA